MIDATIVGLDRWSKALVEAVQSKSGGLRFTRTVGGDPDSHAHATKSDRRISDV
jgi:hypothetical protein